MDIWEMKYFIQVCNDKSFSKAADNINISQQGLSKAIKNLEQELEIQLFHRSSKGVVPTKFGHLLLEEFQGIVNEYDCMVNFLYNKAKIEKGTILLGLPQILYPNIFAVMICEFREAYPEIKLKIAELGSYMCEKSMEDGLVDISLAVKPINKKSLDLYQLIPVT